MGSSVVRGGWLLAMMFVLSACHSGDLEGPRVVALRDVTVIDGTGAALRPHQTVVLKGETILDLGPVEGVEIPPEAQVEELSGHFLVPGFIDLHVHFPEDSRVHDAMLARLLEYGVTTLLNPGARPGAGVDLRQRIRDGEALGPRMFTAGPIIDSPPVEEGLRGWSFEATDESAIRGEVQRQASLGVDWIKLYRHVPPDLVKVAVEEAEAWHLPVVGHMGETLWQEAARAGVSMLVHSGWGTPMDEVVDLENPTEATDREWYDGYAGAAQGRRFATLAETLVEEGVTVVPTLSITQASALGADAALLPQFRVELAPDRHVDDWWSPGWETRHPQHNPDSEEEGALLATVYLEGVWGILRGFYERGVTLGVGTDVGNSWMTPGFVFHHEIALYQDAGIPPLAILKMATHNGAAALGILDQVGTVEVGKRADLILLQKDPSLDIRHTLDIEAVYLAGERVSAGSSRAVPPGR